MNILKIFTEKKKTQKDIPALLSVIQYLADKIEKLEDRNHQADIKAER